MAVAPSSSLTWGRMGLASSIGVGLAIAQPLLVRTVNARGPWMVVVKVKASMPAAKPPLDCVYIKQRFMAAIGCAEPATARGRS